MTRSQEKKLFLRKRREHTGDCPRVSGLTTRPRLEYVSTRLLWSDLEGMCTSNRKTVNRKCECTLLTDVHDPGREDIAGDIVTGDGAPLRRTPIEKQPRAVGSESASNTS
ncbi:hypothetical protein EVAR_48226_1 [Eumeta japonica]|uniref:Uncharacterized protein n=1 Tax=Eumeta variegata TaxID=151549 RepID=A0A4C1YIE0_EUMVA|nr:hypothetical protein EVAR_48226_1 [Eumeta japonica]